jgi:hypothetical protein
MRRFLLLLLLTAILTLQPDLTTTAQEAETITILQRTPERDAVDIQTNTPVTVVFSAPVIPLVGTADLAALPAPVRISPAVDGLTGLIDIVDATPIQHSCVDWRLSVIYHTEASPYRGVKRTASTIT